VVSRAASSWGARQRLRHRLEQSWLLIPGAYVVGALALGRLMPAIDGAIDDALDIGVTETSAGLMLQAVASGMLAFSGLVVQFGAAQYTPRLVQRFRSDPLVKHALGIFVAPAIYAIVSIGRLGAPGVDETPVLTVATANLMLIVAIVAFFALIARLLDMLRPRRLYAMLREGCEVAIEQIYPEPYDAAGSPATAPSTPVVQTITRHGETGVLAAVDLPLLVREARRHALTIELSVRVGEYLRHGAEVMRIHGNARLEQSARVRRALLVAEERSLTQDPAYAVRAIVDIAIRALSPAVNDPTTAVQGIDTLDSLLHRLALRDLGSGVVLDEDGVVRVLYPAADWNEILDLALTEIRAYGASSHQVARRLYALLASLERGVPDGRRPAVLRQRALLDAAVELHHSGEERRIAQALDHTGLGGRRGPATAEEPLR
jgi:uncharacterized membrane protein